MKKVDTSPDEHLASFPDDIHEQMVELDRLISACFAGRTRTVWEGVFWGGTEQHIIGYGDIVQPRPREDVEWFAVGLARQKNHFSIYVNAVDDGQYLLAQYKEARQRSDLPARMTVRVRANRTPRTPTDRVSDQGRFGHLG